eukprot:6290257-Karenia_brevis.AAC.1
MKTKWKTNKRWSVHNYFVQQCLLRKKVGWSLSVVGKYGCTKHTMFTNVHLPEANVKSLNAYMPEF